MGMAGAENIAQQVDGEHHTQAKHGVIDLVQDKQPMKIDGLPNIERGNTLF